MRKETYLKGIKALMTAFKDKDIDPAFMWNYLSDIQDDRFLHAINMLIMNSKDINKATNIIALIREYSRPDIDRAEDAWSMVCNAAKSRGFNAGHGFDDEIMIRAINSVGWHDICFTDYERLAFVRKNFIDAYKAISNESGLEHDRSITSMKVKGMIGNIIKGIENDPKRPN